MRTCMCRFARERYRFPGRADPIRHRKQSHRARYLVNYTNAAFIIKDGFKLPDDGLFSGFDAEKKTYDKSTWNYEEVEI